jgi:hypothetical protein
MKATKEFIQLSGILNQNLGIHKNNCATVIDFAIALQKSRTVNLSQMVNYSEKLAEIKPESIYKNYQRLIQKSKLSQSDLAKCIVAMYGLEDCKLTLSMDRTNWRYGKADINFLVLSVCLIGTAIPLYWLELDTKGNSDTEERIKLMKLFITDFGVAKIDFLVADREFIGNDWFNYLHTSGINFSIRIKSNMLIELNNGEKVRSGELFKIVSRGGVISHQVKIDGMNLLAQATRSPENELIIVVSNNLAEPNLLVIYAKRWRIECLFGQLKTRGFNLEDTHFTLKDRVGNLMKFVVLAFAICYLIGLVGSKKHPILLKKHGFKQKSYFRHGYDLLIRTLNSGISMAIKLITICFEKMNLEEKCQQLICVL